MSRQRGRRRAVLRTKDAAAASPSSGVGFARIGGLENHLRLLRELVVFPLKYAELYTKFDIKPPKGVLFYGPPGTGKSLVASALADEFQRSENQRSNNSLKKIERVERPLDVENVDAFASKTSKTSRRSTRVSFFGRKGADILDKYVGESERKLRELFATATKKRPSIIFFDELDGLAPTRSSREDHIHTSIVATLLALMDGLGSTAGIVIIGATNRIDAIDPALRRPGRFDRELYFPLPCLRSRFEILKIYTASWTSATTTATASIDDVLLGRLAEITAGYCGSDLQALCAEAVLCCFRRTYPRCHERDVDVDVNSMEIEPCDFLCARSNVTPSSRRTTNPLQRLNETVRPLLSRQFNAVVEKLQATWPHFLDKNHKYVPNTKRYSGRILLTERSGEGQTAHIAPALLDHLEHVPYYEIDVETIYQDSSEALKRIRQARQNTPSVLYMPSMDCWWTIVDECTRIVFLSALKKVDPTTPVLIVVTYAGPVPDDIGKYARSTHTIVVEMDEPTVSERELFLSPLFVARALRAPVDVKRETRATRPGNVRRRDENENEIERGGSPPARKIYRIRRRSGSSDESVADDETVRTFVRDLSRERVDTSRRRSRRPTERSSREVRAYSKFDPW